MFRTNIYYDGANQDEADRHYSSLDNKSQWVNKKVDLTYNKFGHITLKANYETKEGALVLAKQEEYKFDERNNRTLAVYIGEEETIKEKIAVDYYAAAFTQYELAIKQVQEKLNKPKDESEKKTLNQKLEDLKKEFEAKKKKYTLTEEKYSANEKLEFSSYKLLFFNPRGPAEKRLMRVDLDQFYRPVKVGFEEE